MDVILREDVDNLGKAGELVSVKDGYARNFLLPRGLAFHATEGNRRKIEAEKGQKAKKHQAEVGAAREVATRLEAVSLTFTMKAGEGDKLFGSVTASEIAERLAGEGFKVDKKQVDALTKGRAARAINDLDQAKGIKGQLEATSVTVAAKAGQSGRLFGAVSNGDIAAAVKAAGGPELDKRKIEVKQAIKTLGSYEATVRLHPEVAATLTFEVVSA